MTRDFASCALVVVGRACGDGKETIFNSTLFLDLNYWINSSQAPESELSRRLHSAVQSGKLGCVLTPTLLMEVWRIRNSDQRARIGALMDDLTAGCSLRPLEFTYQLELLANLGLQIPEAFGPSAPFLIALQEAAYEGLRSSLPVFLPNLDEDTVLRAAQSELAIPRDVLNVSIQDFLHMELDQNPLAQMDEVFAALGGADRDIRPADGWKGRGADSERAGAVLRFQPQTNDVIDLARGQDLEVPTLLDDVRDLCPSFYLAHSIPGALRENRSLFKRGNDLFDTLNIAQAPAYLDAVAVDRGMRHVCVEMLDLPTRYGCAILQGDDSVVDWLRQLEAGRC